MIWWEHKCFKRWYSNPVFNDLTITSIEPYILAFPIPVISGFSASRSIRFRNPIPAAIHYPQRQFHIALGEYRWIPCIHVAKDCQKGKQLGSHMNYWQEGYQFCKLINISLYDIAVVVNNAVELAGSTSLWISLCITPEFWVQLEKWGLLFLVSVGTRNWGHLR